MPFTYNKTISGNFGGNFHASYFELEIEDSSISIPYLFTNINGDNIEIVFDSELSAPDLVTLNNLIANHNPPPEPRIDDPNILLNTAFRESVLGINGVITGGITPLSGLTVTVSNLEYALNGNAYVSAETQVILDTADLTNNRIDCIYADTLGRVGVVSGIPSATPVAPELSIDRVAVTCIEIPAGSTSIGGTSFVLYEENLGSGSGEWDITESTSGARININSTNTPYAGIKVIETTNVLTGDKLIFTPGSAFQTSNFGFLEFRIKTKGIWEPDAGLEFKFFENNSNNGISVILNDTNPLFNSSLSDYQFIRINTDEFQFNKLTITSLEIRKIQFGASLDYFLDNVKIQDGTGLSVNNVQVTTTAENVGTSGVGIFKEKIGNVIRLKSINSGSSKITITDDTGNNEIDIDVDETTLNHDNLTNFVTDEHVDHSGVSIIAGEGLSGGGDITTSRTIDLDINSLTVDSSPQNTDYLVTYDISTSSHKKVSITDVVSSGISSIVDEVSDDTKSSTTLKTYQHKLRMTTGNLSSGKYRIGWYAEVGSTSTSGAVEARIELNDITEMGNCYFEPDDSDNIYPFTGFKYQTLSGINTFDIDYRKQESSNSGNSFIQNARIEIWKV